MPSYRVKVVYLFEDDPEGAEDRVFFYDVPNVVDYSQATGLAMDELLRQLAFDGKKLDNFKKQEVTAEQFIVSDPELFRPR